MGTWVAGEAECALEATVVEAGRDLVVVLRGGNAPHVGACVVALPRPSLTGNGARSVTSSVLNLTGHKDEEIARPLAEHLARCLDRVVVVTGGYHLDGADRAQIRAVEGNARLLGSMLAAALSRADRNPGGQ